MNIRFAAVAAILAIGLSSIASAAVVGGLGAGDSGTVTATLTSILWNPDPGATPPGPPWNANVSSGTTLSFAGCSGVLGSAGCLSATEGIEVNNAAALTAATVLPENTFFQFAAHPNLVWSLEFVFSGSSNTNCQALGTFGTCSLFVGSPIVLELNANGGTTATLTLSGKASDTGVAGLATGNHWSGSFTDIIADKSPGQIQLALCPSGTCTGADFIANRSITEPDVAGHFTAVIPEPGTVSLMVAGLVLVAAGGWRRRAKRG